MHNASTLLLGEKQKWIIMVHHYMTLKMIEVMSNKYPTHVCENMMQSNSLLGPGVIIS